MSPKAKKWTSRDKYRFEDRFLAGATHKELLVEFPHYNEKQVGLRFDVLTNGSRMQEKKEKMVLGDPRKWDFTLDNLEVRN